jgi:hypothetical protein
VSPFLEAAIAVPFQDQHGASNAAVYHYKIGFSVSIDVARG